VKHVNVALFVAHEGCPHTCSFCNQRTISGFTKRLKPQDVDEACRIALSSGRVDAKTSEIAFFGGSFTAIDRDYMLCLLERANEYINKGLFKGVRISTRPDCINEEILNILKKNGVSAIELGAQSMDDGVLSLNERGHTADDVRNASRLIKEYGFELGLQMMTGLYGSSYDRDVFTAEELIKLNPETVRIYPTVVLEGTRLAELMRSGEYKPQTLDEAVELCARLLLMFEEKDIKVIRLGLHSGGNVDEGYLAGAYHPAFRELCESRIFLKKMLSLLENKDKSKQYVFEVAEKSLSKALGQLKSNEKALKNEGYCCIIKCNTILEKYEIILKE
jgi:histone acetyltransferase (RNA polymerase elongator complex component)